MSDTTTLIDTAVNANATLIDSAITLQQAAETFDADFIVSAQSFAAARDGGVSIAALAKALKARAGSSSVALRGVQWFTANASIEAHAYTGRLYNLPGSLADEVTPADVQTLITQVYNAKGGAARVKWSLKADDREAAYQNLKESYAAARAAEKAEGAEEGEDESGSESSGQAGIEDLLAAAAGPILKAAALAEEQGVSAEALALVATLWKALAAIDEVADKAQLRDEAADLADINS